MFTIRKYLKKLVLPVFIIISLIISTVVTFASGGKSQTDAEEIILNPSSQGATATIHGTTRTWANEKVEERDYFKFSTSNNRGSTYSITVTHDGGTQEDLQADAFAEGEEEEGFFRSSIMSPYETSYVFNKKNLKRNTTHYIWLKMFIASGYIENADYTIKITENIKKPVKQKIKKLTTKKKKATIQYTRDAYTEKYQIAYKKKNASKWKFKETTNNIYTIKNLKSKKQYTFKVRGSRVCYNKRIYGGWSKAKTIKIK